MDTKIVKKDKDEPKTVDDVKVVSTTEHTEPKGADGKSDYGHHDYTAEPKSDSKVVPDQPSNRPGGISSSNVMPPKSSGAGVDPEKHIIDPKTGLTATGSDHPGNPPSKEPLAPGEKPTLDHYSQESAAVASEHTGDANPKHGHK